MPSKSISSGAVQADADLCNAVDLPTLGCHAGGGLHVNIPGDWQTRIAAAQAVPGVTYYSVAGGVLVVSAYCSAQLAIPAVVSALSVGLQAQAALIAIKLSTAQAIP